jgi:hypothetical protein
MKRHCHIVLAFTGVYAHQRAMRDFVTERDLALARQIHASPEEGTRITIRLPDRPATT